MDGKLLTNLGKIAGLGGIALGVFLILFRDALQREIPPSVILALMILTFGIAAIGVIAWLISRATALNAIPASSLAVLVGLVVVIVGAAVFVGKTTALPDRDHQQDETCRGTTELRDGPIEATNWQLTKNPTLHLDVGPDERIVHAYVITQNEINAAVSVSDVKISPDGKHATAACSANSPGGGHTNAVGECFIRGTIEIKSGNCTGR